MDPDNENEDGSKKHSNSTKYRNRKSDDEISDSFGFYYYSRFIIRSVIHPTSH